MDRRNSSVATLLVFETDVSDISPAVVRCGHLHGLAIELTRNERRQKR